MANLFARSNDVYWGPRVDGVAQGIFYTNDNGSFPDYLELLSSKTGQRKLLNRIHCEDGTAYYKLIADKDKCEIVVQRESK